MQRHGRFYPLTLILPSLRRPAFCDSSPAEQDSGYLPRHLRQTRSSSYRYRTPRPVTHYLQHTFPHPPPVHFTAHFFALPLYTHISLPAATPRHRTRIPGGRWRLPRRRVFRYLHYPFSVGLVCSSCALFHSPAAPPEHLPLRWLPVTAGFMGTGCDGPTNRTLPYTMPFPITVELPSSRYPRPGRRNATTTCPFFSTNPTHLQTASPGHTFMAHSTAVAPANP